MARREHDYYPTPRWPLARLLEVLPLPDQVPWLEPCVGDGALLRHVASLGYDVAWRTNDLRDVPQPPGSVLHSHARAEAWLRDHGQRDSVCLTNPPFNAAFPIVVSAVEVCGIVVMLLPTSWIGTQGRTPWLREHPPAVYWIPERIDFLREDAHSASRNGNQNYAWLAWGLGHSENAFLADTPESERKRDEAAVAGVAIPHQPTLFGEEYAA
jgi:hypothetical protein